MQISYDRSLPLGIILESPWTAAGLHLWLDDVVTITSWGWGKGFAASPADHLVPPDITLGKKWGMVLQTPGMAAAVQAACQPRALFAARTDHIPLLERQGYQIVTSAPRRWQPFERKQWLRRELGGVLPMPPFEIMPVAELIPEPAGFEKIMAGRERIVLQAGEGSGGRGTYFAQTFDEYQRAVQQLQAALAPDEEIVVSTFIPNARVRSIQACVAEHDVFIGPLQKQYIRTVEQFRGRRGPFPYFAGAEIDGHDPAMDSYPQARLHTQRIGDHLRAAGFRGVFGVDMLVTQDGELYVLELNARLTGVTPLLMQLASPGAGFPVQLLHILESIGSPYTVTEADQDLAVSGSSQRILLHGTELRQFAPDFRPGLYAWDAAAEQLTYAKPAIRLEPLPGGAEAVLIEPRLRPGVTAQPGDCALRANSFMPLLDAEDQPIPQAQALTRALERLAFPSLVQ